MDIFNFLTLHKGTEGLPTYPGKFIVIQRNASSGNSDTEMIDQLFNSFEEASCYVRGRLDERNKGRKPKRSWVEWYIVPNLDVQQWAPTVDNGQNITDNNDRT